MFSDDTLTATNLFKVLGIVTDWFGDGGLTDQMSVPVSEVPDLLDEAERKEKFLTTWVETHPAPSWKVVAEALYRLGEHRILLDVKKNYITGKCFL